MLKEYYTVLKSLIKELKYILKQEEKNNLGKTLSPEVIKRYNCIAKELNTKLNFKLEVFPEDTNPNMVTHPSTISLLSKTELVIDNLREQTIPYWHQTTWGYFLISLMTVVLGGAVVAWLTT